jgi:hypothetical protein
VLAFFIARRKRGAGSQEARRPKIRSRACAIVPSSSPCSIRVLGSNGTENTLKPLLIRQKSDRHKDFLLAPSVWFSEKAQKLKLGNSFIYRFSATAA